MNSSNTGDSGQLGLFAFEEPQAPHVQPSSGPFTASPRSVRGGSGPVGKSSESSQSSTGTQSTAASMQTANPSVKTAESGLASSGTEVSGAGQKTAETSREPKVISISTLNAMIRGKLEGEFGKIWVRGEISNFKPHTSGHFYFSLKDETSQIAAVMFKGHNQKLKFRPENGMEVLVRGKITVYEPRGNYQIFCESMEPVGAGALQKAFEQLKAKLQQEGLFDVARKKTLPKFPKHIGIVTSPTGAAIRDILNILKRRNKLAHVTLIPALVQGDPAPGSIVNAISLAHKMKTIDVLIVGRGGGSIEDLWAFNDERVARAIAACQMPVISAVGHEIDFTIADFVADLRAPTPSAAAELVVQNADDLMDQIQVQLSRLLNLQKNQIKYLNQSVQQIQRRLIDPKRRLQDLILRCDELMGRLEQGWKNYSKNLCHRIAMGQADLGSPKEKIESLKKRAEILLLRLSNKTSDFVVSRRSRMEKTMASLDALSPLRVVDRGYSIVSNSSKNLAVVKNADQVSEGDVVSVRLAQGGFEATVNKKF
jgi:exodeoxyribonuclease VII large subunit